MPERHQAHQRLEIIYPPDPIRTFHLTGGGWAGGGEQNDIVDLYDHSGAYRHSFRLPGPARDHVWLGDRLFLLQLSPYPALVGLDRRTP